MSIPRKRLKKKINGTIVGELPRKKKETPEWVKRAADRAERRARGELEEPERQPRPDPIVDEDSLGPILDPEEVLDEPIKEPSVRTSSTKSGHHRAAMRLASTYDPEYHPKAAAEMVLNGATERDLVVAFQITSTVLRMWMTQYPEFAAACTITREASLADERVARSVYEMANGYTIPETKVFVYKGEVIKVPIRKYVPKDINAAKYWLMNRDPTRWGKTGDSAPSDGGSLGSININMIRGMTTEQIRQTMAVLKQVMAPNTTLGRLDQMNINNDAEVLEGEFAEVSDGEQTET